MTTTINDLASNAKAPCPEWCDTGQGHRYTVTKPSDGYAVGREHGAVFSAGSIEVEIVQEATAVTAEAEREDLTGSPVISFYVEDNYDDMSATAAREVADQIKAALYAAAERLERIEAGR